MKHLLSGVALAALLTTALPAMAQTSSSGTSANPQSGATTPSDSMGKSSGSGGKSAAKHRSTPSDNMAEELNRQELQRVQSGGQAASGNSQAPSAAAPASGQSQAPITPGAAPSGGASSAGGTEGSGTSGAH